MTRTDEAIARLDSYRARKIGQMLVTEDAPEFGDDPKSVLIDVAKLNGRELLDQFSKRHSRYGTAPFDVAGNKFRCYPGGVTIWSGFPGAGKTTLLRQLVCHLLHKGSFVFLASLEEDPRDVLVRLAATAVGADEPTAPQMQGFIDAYAERFRLWGVIGIAKHRQLLGVVRKLAEEGLRHCVIDSLMCLDIQNDDFEEQRKFANLLAATARAAGIHIHLVAHPRKLVSADQDPDINDVAGARELGGVADNVIFVRRAKNETENANAERTGMCIVIRKQRHGSGYLGNVTGWYQRKFRQFSEEQFSGAIDYLPYGAVYEP